MQNTLSESAGAGEGGLGRRSVAQRVHAQVINEFLNSTQQRRHGTTSVVSQNALHAGAVTGQRIRDARRHSGLAVLFKVRAKCYWSDSISATLGLSVAELNGALR